MNSSSDADGTWPRRYNGGDGKSTRQGHNRGTPPVQRPALSAGLYVVATPIGNLRDITLRALETLAAADVIACEDTRVTRKLLDHYGIATPLTPYHEHNAAVGAPQASGSPRCRRMRRPGIRRRNAAGVRPRLQAGTGCAARLDTVVTVPGASAALAALSIAGLPTAGFSLKASCRPRMGSAPPALRPCRASQRHCCSTSPGRAWLGRWQRWRLALARARPRYAAS